MGVCGHDRQVVRSCVAFDKVMSMSSKKRGKSKRVGIDPLVLAVRVRGRELVSSLLRAVRATKEAPDELTRANAVKQEAEIRAQLLTYNAEVRAAGAAARPKAFELCPACGAQLALIASGGLAPHYRAGSHELCAQTLRRFRGEAESRSTSVRTVSGGLPGSGRRT